MRLRAKTQFRTRSQTGKRNIRRVDSRASTPPLVRPSSRGWRHRFGGHTSSVPVPVEWRGTSHQVPGLWPFSAGDGTPVDGVPLGTSLTTGTVVADDVFTSFELGRARSPYGMVLGLNGLGKSSLVRRMAVGSSAFGIMPWILGDVKNEYAPMIRALGGEVFSVAPGKAGINVLDVTQAVDAADKLLTEAKRLIASGEEKAAQGLTELASKVLAAAHARRKNMVASLITIARGSKPAEHEDMIVDAGLRYLDRTRSDTPIMGDLLALVQDPPPELRAAAIDGGRIERYKEKTEALEESLTGLTGLGVFGDTFAGHTSMVLDRSRPVSFDLSGIDQTQTQLRAAALMAAWSYGFGVIDAANALADAGLEPQRNYLIVMDEMWQALRAGEGMVNRLDAITRLNRLFGIGMLFITHAIGDFYALSSAAEVQIAREFINRASLLFIGGVTDTEIPRLEEIVFLNRREKARLKSWNDPGPLDPETGTYGDPPGRGKFLLKAGNNAGIPFQLHLVPAEIPLNDTNQRFSRSTTKAAA